MGTEATNQEEPKMMSGICQAFRRQPSLDRHMTPSRRHVNRSVLLGVTTAAVLVLGGCWKEKPCGDDQYPVKAKDAGGSICVRSGDPIPSNFTTYPPGATPTGH